MVTWYPRTSRINICFIGSRYDVARRQSVVNSMRNASNVASYAPGSANTTIAPRAGLISRSVRTTSRRRRLIRLRSTAECEWRGTTIPTRGGVDVATVRISSTEPRSRLPFARTSAMSGPRVSRSPRGKRNLLRSGVLRRQLHCQALSPFLSAPAQYLPPPLRGHASAEPVLSDPLLVSRAICRFSHHYS